MDALNMLAVAVLLAVNIPHAPHRWVTDDAQALSAVPLDDLEGELQWYAQQSGHQVIVYVGTTTGDESLEDWTTRAFTQWKIGRPGVDDGVAVFFFTQDHTARIVAGTGLTRVLTPDVRARIVHDADGADLDSKVTGTVGALIHKLGPGLPAPRLRASSLAALASLAVFIAFALSRLPSVRTPAAHAARGHLRP